MSVEPQVRPRYSGMVPVADRLSRLPYWLLIMVLIGVLMLWGIVTSQDYRIIFDAVIKGVRTTISVTAISFSLAVIVGLLFSLMRISRLQIFQQISSFYIELMRGVPMLVLLYYISFAAAPAIVSLYNQTLGPVTGVEINIRQFDFTARAVMALVLAYSAFIAETFRAGILSVEKEQTEAAQVEGASNWQVMRYIVLPQAVRNILPALGNDLIAMLKDSSLVSVLGVQDITQLGRLYASSTFLFFETYNVVAFLYLVMTLGLAILVRYVEKRLSLDER